MKKMLGRICGCCIFLLGVATWSVGFQSGESYVGPAPATKAPASSNSPTKSVPKDTPPTFQERRPRYRLAPGDVVNLSFPFSPEFDQTLTVQPDGYVSLKEIGDFYAQGKTAPELSAALTEAYGKILNKPVITVDLKDFQKPYFIAGGEVGHPGKYDLREDTTAAQAVAIAGGFTDASKHSQVLLFRRVNADYVEVKKLNMKKMLSSANLQEDVFLRPGDMLFVPKNRISKIRRFMPYEALSMYYTPLR